MPARGGGEARPGARGLRGRGAPAQVPLAIQERARKRVVAWGRGRGLRCIRPHPRRPQPGTRGYLTVQGQLMH